MIVSFGSVWEEAAAFVKAEFALLAPLSLLCFGLPMVALLLAVPTDAAQAGQLKPGRWMIWLLPCGFMSMLGSIAVSALALSPGISVGESIALAFRRIPSGLGLFLFYLGLQVVLSIPLALAGMLEGAEGPITTLVYLGSLAFVVWMFVRVMPIWAIVADRVQSPVATVLQAFRLTRGCYVRLLALRVVMAVAVVVAMVVVLIPIGAITRLIGQAAGNPEIGMAIAFVCMGVLVSAVVGTWTVYVARLYRRLEDASSGT